MMAAFSWRSRLAQHLLTRTEEEREADRAMAAQLRATVVAIEESATVLRDVAAVLYGEEMAAAEQP